MVCLAAADGLGLDTVIYTEFLFVLKIAEPGT